MMVIGSDATNPERLISRALASGVWKYSQVIRMVQVQPASPAMSAGVRRQTSRIRISAIGRSARKMERGFMGPPESSFGQTFRTGSIVPAVFFLKEFI